MVNVKSSTADVSSVSPSSERMEFTLETFAVETLYSDQFTSSIRLIKPNCMQKAQLTKSRTRQNAKEYSSDDITPVKVSKYLISNSPFFLLYNSL